MNEVEGEEGEEEDERTRRGRDCSSRRQSRPSCWPVALHAEGVQVVSYARQQYREHTDTFRRRRTRCTMSARRVVTGSSRLLLPCQRRRWRRHDVPETSTQLPASAGRCVAVDEHRPKRQARQPDAPRGPTSRGRHESWDERMAQATPTRATERCCGRR